MAELLRPSAEDIARYDAAWWTFLEGEAPGTRILQAAMAANPKVVAFIRTQFTAACFLEERLVSMGLPPDHRKQECFRFGQACVGRPDPWAVFDKFIARNEAILADITDRKAWTNVPVQQEIPQPTTLLAAWYSHAKMSVGEKGVYPQPLFHRDSEDRWTIEALALDGEAAMRHTTDRLREGNIVEFVVGIDMSSVHGQGLEFDDFLAVIWYVNGLFLTGVINYQKEGDAPEPAFREIDWSNNYWNHALREHPIPSMEKALVQLPPNPA